MDLMTRLYEECARIPKERTRWDRASLQRALREAMPINVQNVANYLYETEQEYWRIDRDFPNLAPPWPLFFMSYKYPRWSNSEGTIVPAPLFGAEAAYLFTAAPMKPENPFGAKWFVVLLYWMVGPYNSVHQDVQFMVDPQGAFMSINGPNAKTSEHAQFLCSDIVLWPSFEKIAEPFFQTMVLQVPFLSLSFLHCRNVALQRDPVPPAVHKKRLRRHEWAPDATHTLRIEPMTKVLSTVRTSSGKLDLKRSLHLHRGHFKDFSQGKGLFGKHHGLYWWSAFLGDRSHAHQYIVNPPND